MMKKRYKSYHIIVIPYNTGRTRNIFLPVRTLKILRLMIIVILFTAAALITLHTKNYYSLRTDLYPTLKENSMLDKENSKLKKEKERYEFVADSLTKKLFSERAVYREKLKSLSLQARRVKNFAEELRIMVGFKLEPKEAQPPGLGGPVPEDTGKVFLRTEDVQSIEILSSFEKAESSLFIEFSSTRKKLDKLWDYFEGKNSIIEGTPELQPVPGSVLSGFGYRISPFTGREEFHKGVDIPAAIGTKIKSPADGVVIFVGWMRGYGRIIKIDHGSNYKTVYGHLHKFDVEVGDRVKKGDFIGEVGNSGRSTGPHLHYEVRLNDIAVDPENYFVSVEERKKDFEKTKIPDEENNL
jgi:murein DD-endopeptidase MepM/ murein hydrolase activator NlpD